MLKKLSRLIAVAIVAVGLVSPPLALAATTTPNTPTSIGTNSKDAACGSLTQLDSTQGCGSTAATNLGGNLASNVVTWLSWIVGFLAIIMIVVAGFKYITSNGDSNKVGSAKHTLIYALIGLVVAVLAQLLVRLVLSNL